MGLYFYLDRVGRDAIKVLREELLDALGGLVGYEAHTNLGLGLGGQYRLGTLADVATPDAVDIEGRAYAGAL